MQHKNFTLRANKKLFYQCMLELYLTMIRRPDTGVFRYFPKKSSNQLYIDKLRSFLLALVQQSVVQKHHFQFLQVEDISNQLKSYY